MPETKEIAVFYLDDLKVGQRFKSGTHALDAEQIKAFAAEFDPQPCHMDEKLAEDSILEGLAASGWHTAAITMRLNVEGGLPLAGGIIGSGGELQWPMPTRAGDILHVENEILEITPSQSRPDRGRVTVLVRTANQHGQTLQTLKAKLVVRRKPADQRVG
ncbi:MAG TPA: MaoC family dehydratase [Pseudolabrys sp.]|nr:MaoC family dehydratase [Pseudolabrys sp.]